MDKSETLQRYKRQQKLFEYFGIVSPIFFPISLLGFMYGCLFPIGDRLKASHVDIGKIAMIHLGMIIIFFVVFFWLMIMTFLKVAKFMLRCPSCHTYTQRQFDHGGRCEGCNALLNDRSAYLLREQWLQLPSEVHQRHREQFAERGRTRRQFGNSNLYVFFGALGYLILISWLADLYWSQRDHNYDWLGLMPYLGFMAYWLWKHQLPPVSCPNCGENAYDKKGSLLFRYHCNHCGAQLVMPKRTFMQRLFSRAK